MKAQLYSKSGEKKSELELPALFNTKIRPDIVQKYLKASSILATQPYAPNIEAGKKYSASGTISHKRHDWKGHYGRGISRIPRKTMWRRGTQFYWIGATISGTRGGRRAHPPKIFNKLKKINKKEVQLAINSALAATANPQVIISRYQTLDKIENVPAIIESIPEKTKDFLSTIKKIFPNLPVLKNKTTRSGKGKLRGRKYKSSSGLLIITSEKEQPKHSGFDIKSSQDLTISDLYPLGRITLYTKKAIEELSQKPKEKEE
tara:strand:+ start:7462 stop:8244 length:783 start_codon:yes stop_codon:yes gene_type:complete